VRIQLAKLLAVYPPGLDVETAKSLPSTRGHGSHLSRKFAGSQVRKLFITSHTSVEYAAFGLFITSPKMLVLMVQ